MCSSFDRFRFGRFRFTALCLVNFRALGVGHCEVESLNGKGIKTVVSKYETEVRVQASISFEHRSSGEGV